MAGWLFLFLLSLASAKSQLLKPLNLFEGIQIGVGWLLTMDLDSQPSLQLGNYPRSYGGLILLVVWLYKILKTENSH